MNEPNKKPPITAVQTQAHFWGDPRLAPADARAAINPAPQAPGPNEKFQIVHSRFDLARD